MKFNALITGILARFARGTGPEMEQLVEQSLREIVEFIGVDYAVVIRTSDDMQYWSVAFEWCSPGTSSLKGAHQNVSMGTWNWNEQVLLGGNVLQINRMDEIPREAKARLQMESLGFRSTLQVPTRRPGGQVSGCIALFSLCREITWDEVDIQRLRLAGEAIANAIERARVENQLRESEQRLRSALDQVKRLSEQLRVENHYLREEISSSLGFDEIVGESTALRHVLQQVEHVASTDASVLLLGETGTGKELFARAIHQCSRREKHRMVKVNLAALPASLMESELFGHVKGAFTGATENKIGRFELADGGTLFLDEIGELAPSLQTKLLRVLQEGEFERLGSGESRRVDVRILAATNRDLVRAMDQQRFRPDLYYRLAVFPIAIPPLRDRREDIPLLVWRFLSSRQVRLGRDIRRIPDEVMLALVEYDWPGNVRELENVVERAMILTKGHDLVLDDSFRTPSCRAELGSRTTFNAITRSTIVAALEDSSWKIKGHGNAADRLGLKPSTLRYRMKTLGITRPPSLPR